MDLVSLSLAVDSSQVNSASAALEKFAVSGAGAEASATKLIATTGKQGTALAALVQPAQKTAVALGGVASAADKVGNEAGNFSAVTAETVKTALAAARLEVAEAKLGAAIRANITAQERLNQLRLAGASIRPAAIQEAQQRVSDTGAAVSASQARVLSAQQALKPVPPNVPKSYDDLAKAQRRALQQNQQLAFQLNDFAVQVASGQSPLIALVQQGSQLSGTFGGIRPAISAVLGLITPLRVAFGGAAAGVGLLAAAYLEAQNRGAELSRAIVLTGNAAGITKGQFSELADEIARATNTSIGSTKEALQGLVASGQVSSENIQATATAVQLLAKVTNQSAEEIIKDFARAGEAPAKFAAELNRTYNFLTASQLAYIRQLDEQGDKQKALAETLRLLNPRLADGAKEVTGLTAAYQSLTNELSRVKDSFVGLFEDATPQKQLAEINKQIDQLKKAGQTRPLLFGPSVAELEQQKKGFEQQIEAQNAGAKNAAELAKLNREGADATQFIKGMQDRANTTSALTRELEAANAAFAKQDALAAKDPTFKATSQQERTTIFQDIIKRGTDKAPKRGRVSNEAEQVRRETLAQNLDTIRSQLAAEREALEFHNRLLSAQYQAGTLSLKDYYEARRKEIEDGTAAQANALKRERETLEKELPSIKDKSERERTLGKIAEVKRDEAALPEKSRRELALTNIESEQSFKRLSEQVQEYRASLLEMSGDELGAARIRAQIDNQRTITFQTQTRGTSVEITDQEVQNRQRTISQTAELNAARRQTSVINEQLSIQEERIAIAQRTGSITSIEAMQQVSASRRVAITQLEEFISKQEEIASDPLFKDNLELKLSTERARLELDKLKADLDPLKEQFDNLFKGAGQSALETLFNTGNAKKAGVQFFDEITRGINATVAKNFSEQLFGKGGIFGGIGGIFSGGFGGGSVATPPINGDPRERPGLFGAGIAAGAQAPVVTAITTASTTNSTAISTALSTTSTTASGAIVSAVNLGSQAVVTAIQGLQLGGGSAQSVFAAFDTQGIGIGSTQPSAQRDILRQMEGSSGTIEEAATGASAALQTLATNSKTTGASFSGLFNIISSLFSGGGSGGGGYGQLIGSIASLFLHKGGVVGQTNDVRQVSIFNNAPRYHTGGVAGLKPNEVPAVLMGGPKGVREEVLTAKDPRHVDNGGALTQKLLGTPQTIKLLIEELRQESKAPSVLRDLERASKRELGGPVSANSLYRVNEKGPELLQVAGKQYLMTGVQGGNVAPVQAGARSTSVTINQSFAPGTDMRTVNQGARMAGRAVQGVARRGDA